MNFKLIPMARHDERLNKNDAGPIENLLIQLSNIALYRRLSM